MKSVLFLLLFIPILSYSQTEYEKLVDSLQYIQEVPRIHNCDDPILLKIVDQGLPIVPDLIEKMTDKKKLRGHHVPYFGGEYTVGDLAYIALSEIISDIPEFELLGIELSADCGYCSFWWKIREGAKTRKKFRASVKKWYDENKDNLEWVVSDMFVTGDCLAPGRGHYELKNKNKVYRF